MNRNRTRHIILASQSPRRKALLQQVNLEFTVHPSSIEEEIDEQLDPESLAIDLATQKARDVARHYSHALVIGADTVVVHQQQILGKPQNKAEAIELLQMLRDQQHRVITGVCLALVDDMHSSPTIARFAEQTDVFFGSITDDEIEQYVDTGSPMDKAGAYGIQDDWGSLFVQKIDGDYYNVVGFPLYQFYQQLKAIAPECLPHPV